MNKFFILLNDGNVVVIVQYFVGKFVNEGPRNFGLDMTYKIIPDTSQLILCMSNQVRISALNLKIHISAGYGR